MRIEDATALVVDDEIELQEIFASWLRRSGCKVFTAGHGAQALEILASHKIDVLISDINMPIMNGLELVRAVHRLRLAIPGIIFVSGFHDIDLREMYALGVEKLIEKPLRLQDLKAAIQASLQDRGQMWLAPAAEPATQAVVLEMDSVAKAIESCRFQVGRGGCCFAIDSAPDLNQPLSLSIHFVEEGFTFQAQGRLRWFDKKTMHAGLEFDHIESSCRDFVLASQTETTRRTFIPSCTVC